MKKLILLVSVLAGAMAFGERVTLDTSTMTAECWVSFIAADNDAGEANILETGNCPYLGGCFRLYYSAGRLHAAYSYPGNWDGVDVSTDFKANGKWHHLALVLDPDASAQTAGALYIDGAVAVTLPWNTGKSVYMGSNELYVGRRSDDTCVFSGSIENVRIIAEALSPADFTKREGVEPVSTGDLRIAEVCPRPSAMDPNGMESGWVELVNESDEDVDLADYELVRKNRGKEAKAGKAKANLKKRILRPGERTIVWTSEAYPNCEDLGGDGKVAVYGNDAMVYPAKVNPKKFPYLQLYKGTDAKVLVDELIIPVDLKDDWSVAPLNYADHHGCVLLPHPTPAAENNLAGAVDYGPNVGPLYGVKHGLSDLDPLPLATAGADYEVAFAVNPAQMKLAKEGDAITGVDLLYVADYGTVKTFAMTKQEERDAQKGDVWTATIPAADLPGKGGLLRLAANIKTAVGEVWRSPSFCNPDDGYEWYGTIVEPGDLVGNLQTFHLFGAGYSLEQMDVDTDNQDLAKVPYNARVNVFDSQTGRYYDNVRIDLRGNTSANFWKKSHGLRFAKCDPLVCVNPFTGEALEVRKTSFVAEFTDPTMVRQSLAFTFLNEAMAYAPFGYPVRLNLNGSFYQVATHSNRFTDEMIEDWYGFDPLGYGYKNVGRITPELSGGVTIEKKTPDDGDETSETAYAPLKAFAQDIVDAGFGPGVVVREMDLPAWINYLATTRITHETDDVWSNISIYGDLNQTGTWIPLAYDMNQSWGHVYWSSWNGARDGAHADRDQHKSHPLYGGTTVVSHDYWGNSADGNHAIECIYRHPKFRRMYLRRLRTLMDTYLKEPGTAKEDTPIWQDVIAFTNAADADIALDFAKWRNNPGGNEWTDWSKTYIYCWDHPLTHTEGIDDLWENYIVKRRVHLYVTHSVTNAAKQIGYGTNLNAGIPLAQSPLADLRDGMSITTIDAKKGVLVIHNDNDEAIDMSGWTISDALASGDEDAPDYVLGGGVIIDANDDLTLVADRKAYVAANEARLTDEVIVGNVAFTGEEKAVLKAADGTIMAASVPVGFEAIAGCDFTNITISVDALALAEANALSPESLAFTLTLAEGSVTAYADVDGCVRFTVPAAVGSSLAYSIEAAGPDGERLAVGFRQQGEADAARIDAWYDSFEETTGAWTASVLTDDGIDYVLRTYAPTDEQPMDEVVLDSDFTVYSAQEFEDLPDVGQSIAGFTAIDGGWYLDAAEGWIRLANEAAPVVVGETYAVRTRYNRKTGMIGFAIRVGDTYLPLADESGRTAFAVRGTTATIHELAFLGDYPNEHLTGRGVSTDLASVNGVGYATLAEAIAAAREAGTEEIILLWQASIPKGYAAVTRNGVTYLRKLSLSIHIR